MPSSDCPPPAAAAAAAVPTGDEIAKHGTIVSSHDLDADTPVLLECYKCGANISVNFGFVVALLQGAAAARDAELNIRHDPPCGGRLGLPADVVAHTERRDPGATSALPSVPPIAGA